ncbi:MAG TPA: hypothetical protein ENI73_04395 [Spirochaetes bacterium]|nr:hypothetical protein [Spirochaetota bacterium]
MTQNITGLSIKVNGEIITDREINRKYEKYLTSYRHSGSNIDESLPGESKIEWAHQMIDHLLLVQYGRKHHLCPSVEELDKQMMEWTKRLEEDSSPSMGEDIRQDVMTTMIIENVKKRVVSEELSSNESQLKAFYDMNKHHFSQGEAVEVRHLLIRDGDSEDGRKPVLKAKVLMERLKGGEDFGRLAAEFSECPSKERGGDLGYITHGSSDADFEEEIFKLKVMEISGIIESPLGLHIAQVISRVENYISPYEVVKDKLKVFLNQVVCDEAVHKLLIDLRNEAKIEYLGES